MKKILKFITAISQLPRRFFSKISIFAYILESKVHTNVAILSWSRIYWSSINKYTYISDNCWIIKANIGSFCSIASNVMIGGGRHPLNYVSTSPVFYSKKNILKTCFAEAEFKEFQTTIIGNDVWIGSHAFVKAGITIGNGSVIGAYSVVTKNVEPYSIVVGNPAKMIKKRFDDITIEKLTKIQWWNFTDEVLKKKGQYFHNPQDLLKSLETDEFYYNKK